MRQNVSKVLNFRTLWKSLRRQRKSFSWRTLQSMECTILINNELDFSPLLTKIPYTCSLLEIYCKINLFLEVKMCLKKQSSIIFWLKFESKGELKCGGCKVNMACSNLSVSPSCGAVWTFWCSDNLDYYGCKSPPLPFKSPIRLLLKALGRAALLALPAYKSDWGIFSSSPSPALKQLPPSAANIAYYSQDECTPF